MIVHSKRRAFPSISGGGNRLQAPLKKGKQLPMESCFHKPTKKNHGRITSCLFSDAEQDKTPSQEKLALFKEANLGKKKGFPRNKNENFEHYKDVL